MDVVDIHRGVPDIIDDVRAALDGRTLVVVSDVIWESVGKYKELSDKLWDKQEGILDDFITSIEAIGVPVEWAHLPEGILPVVDAMYAKKEYVNSDGVPLSFEDCYLLYAVSNTANVDLMTEDTMLRTATNAECGAGRACSARKQYYERRNLTAKFVGRLLGGVNVGWQKKGGALEYLAGGSCIAVLEDAGDLAGTVRECAVNGMPNAGTAIKAFFWAAILDCYCQCGSNDGSSFSCTCIGNCYDDELDGGLEKDEAWKFLGSLPKNRCNRLWALTKSFGS